MNKLLEKIVRIFPNFEWFILAISMVVSVWSIAAIIEFTKLVWWSFPLMITVAALLTCIAVVVGTEVMDIRRYLDKYERNWRSKRG